MQFKKYTFLLFSLIAFVSCQEMKPAETQATKEKKEAIDKIAQQNSDANAISQITTVVQSFADAYAKGDLDDQLKTTPSGLKYFVNNPGRGQIHPVPGDMVNVHYYGVLPDGTKFDSSFDRMAPFSFRLGMGEVIKGWDEGIPLMKDGGSFVFFVPPHLAYGERGAGTIGGNQELIFLVLLNGFYR